MDYNVCLIKTELCKLNIYFIAHNLSSFISTVLRLSPRIMQMHPRFAFTPCNLSMRHLLQLDIFLAFVGQSWTELHEGAAIEIPQPNCNKTRRNAAASFDGQTFFCSLMCEISESGLKRCCFKNTAGLSLLQSRAHLSWES